MDLTTEEIKSWFSKLLHICLNLFNSCRAILQLCVVWHDELYLFRLKYKYNYSTNLLIHVNKHNIVFAEIYLYLQSLCGVICWVTTLGAADATLYIAVKFPLGILLVQVSSNCQNKMSCCVLKIIFLGSLLSWKEQAIQPSDDSKWLERLQALFHIQGDFFNWPPLIFPSVGIIFALPDTSTFHHPVSKKSYC